MENQEWKITNLNEVDWAFKKIKEAKKELDEQEQYVNQEITRYKEYLENQRKNYEDTKNYFEYKIKEYTDERLKENPNYKLKTAVGSGYYRKSTNWTYDDEEAIIKQLEASNKEEYITVKKSLNKNELRKNLTILEDGTVVTDDGEILEHIKVLENKNFITSIK